MNLKSFYSWVCLMWAVGDGNMHYSAWNIDGFSSRNDANLLCFPPHCRIISDSLCGSPGAATGHKWRPHHLMIEEVPLGRDSKVGRRPLVYCSATPRPLERRCCLFTPRAFDSTCHRGHQRLSRHRLDERHHGSSAVSCVDSRRRRSGLRGP